MKLSVACLYQGIKEYYRLKKHYFTDKLTFSSNRVGITNALGESKKKIGIIKKEIPMKKLTPKYTEQLNWSRKAIILPSSGNLSGHLSLMEHWTTDVKSHIPVTLLNCNPASQICCVGKPSTHCTNDRHLSLIEWNDNLSFLGHSKHSTFSGQSQLRVTGLKWYSRSQFPGWGPSGWQ